MNSSGTSLKVMPLGDSITDGWRTFPGGYRDRLENLFVANGVNFDFVGGEANGPNSLSDRDHEGHSGFRIDEIAASAGRWIANESPDVILLMIGTNDMLQSYQRDSAPQRLSGLIDDIIGRAPQAHVVVASIPPSSRGSLNKRIVQYNSTIPGIVQSKASRGKSVSFVNIYDRLTTADLGDRVHPNRSGYNKIGEAWFSSLRGIVGGSSGGSGDSGSGGTPPANPSPDPGPTNPEPAPPASGGNLTGTPNADTLISSSSSGVSIRGLDGNDTLIGGGGNDVIVGGGGSDTLTGGGGADRFVYSGRWSRERLDRITDFQVGVDKIDFSGLLNASTHQSNTPFPDYIRLVERQGSTRIEFNGKGDRRATFFRNMVEVEGVTGLSANDFVL